jgi:NADPH:quinone reductase
MSSPEHKENPPTSANASAVGDGQCLVRVTAAPITALDLLCATGSSYLGAPALPYVPGISGVGVVERGNSVPSGRRVWFNTGAGMRPGDGSLAEAAVVEEAETVPVPDGVADPVAVALGLSAVAAWMALTRGVSSGPGNASSCLAPAASWARSRCRPPRLSAPRQSSQPPDGRRPELGRSATAAVDLSGADADELATRMEQAAVDSWTSSSIRSAGCRQSAALRVLGDGRRLVQLGSSGGGSATFSSAVVRGRPHSILGYTNNSLSRDQRAEVLSSVFELAGQGRRQVEHEVIELDAVADGWTRTKGSPDRRIVVVPRALGIG